LNLAGCAAALAASHRPLHRARASSVQLLEPSVVAASLARATQGFQAPRPEEPRFQKASEWFLDNHYLASRALRQVQTEFPPGFRRRLPHVGEDSLPRVLRLAQTLLDETSLDLDEAGLLSFVEAYQKQSSLTIAELWALPAMLRIVTLRYLAHVLDALFAPTRGKGPEGSLPVEPDTGVERAVRVFRCLSEMDWRSFVQRTSAVETALSQDPAGVYARMDFDSRDSYRKAVEELAWNTEMAEPEVASLAVALAAEGLAASRPDAGDGREGHVGYYLIDRGRARLKERVRYRGRGVDRARDAVLEHPTLAYLGSIAAPSLLLLAMVAAAMASAFGAGLVALVCALLVVPVTSVIVGVVNWCMSRLLVARRLPKLDFSAAIPPECRTAIVVPALVASRKDLDQLLAQLELHYLSCPDPSLAFVLLTDHVDSVQMPDDSAILAHAEKAVQRLNTRWGDSKSGPFHVLHRQAQWNPGEGHFMGWERKRGKLEELNRLLRGDTTTSYKHRFGDAAGLEGIRFVITLDADTRLPLGAARTLIGLAAHPLNSARFDTRTGRVTAGYTVAQPRVEASPVEGTTTIFSRFWSGDTALDIYTRATSDVYQGLFGAGADGGKGIYEVDAFTRSVEGRVPLNTLASHDLFEGIHGRAALVTDVVVFEQYPRSYLSFARRMHRWIRGDWQLFPWLLPRAPAQNGRRLANRLSLIDRWKIGDNLRRSLLAPSLLALFFLGWVALAGRSGPLFLAPLVLPLVISAPAFLDGQRRQTLGRWALGLVFLPHEAFVACDAILRAVIRMTITRRHLLQWVTAADTARAFAAGSRRQFWREMGPAAALVAAAGTALAFARPAGLPYAAPLLVLWVLSPEVARWVSMSASGVAKEALSPTDRRTLRHLARRTWLFFETFVGPGDQWLAPDNFQEEPGGAIAHRTSPTNIGLMLIAELSAYDLGYIGRAELSALAGQALSTLDRLERYKGHWLNWYNTRTLEPLLPRYVSTVDSGNLAAALLTMAKGCREAAIAPMVRPERFEGLGDTVDLLEESVTRLSGPHPGAAAPIEAIRRTLVRAHGDPSQSHGAAKTLTTSEIPSLEGALLDVLSKCTTNADIATFREGCGSSLAAGMPRRSIT
jgi:cyclic beta-1,2-glucan synthetase